MFISEKLKASRKAKKMTQDELAAAADIAPGTLRRYERGDRVPSADILGRIAKALDMEVSEFYERKIITPDYTVYDTESLVKFTSTAANDTELQKAAKLLISLNDEQLHKAVLILEVLADKTIDNG